MKIDLPVGSIFVFTYYTNFTLKVEKNDSINCADCFFDGRYINNNMSWCELLSCNKYERKDHTDIIFKQIKPRAIG